MTLRVAITRAQPGAGETAERVRALGYDAIVAPLLEVAPCALDTNVDGAQALLFTSANGVRALPNIPAVRDQLVVAVGDATADAARRAGFTYVCSANGDGASLAAVAASLLDPNKGKLIHFAGDHVAGNVEREMLREGFAYERRQAYASIAAPVLPDALKEPLDVVLFHSPRAAETFVALGAPNVEVMVAVCLSPAIARAAGRAPWRRMSVARAPREDALLTALTRATSSRSGASA